MKPATSDSQLDGALRTVDVEPVHRTGCLAFESGGLPLSHRLSIIYLAFPVVVWLVSWFKWWVGIPLAVSLAAGLWRSLSGPWRMSLSLPVLAALLAALGWVLATPVSGLWGFSLDLRLHYTILLDMGRGSWPTYITNFLHDDPPLVAYYLGWHMIPGLASRWLGPEALGWAVPVWTWIGVGLMATLLTRGLSTVRASLVAMAVLVFFSGADVLEHVLRLGPLDAIELILDRLRRNARLEWAGYVVGPETKDLEYQPNTTIFSLAPSHLIGSGLSALVILRSRRRPELAAVSGLLVVICLFWSAIAAVGLLPLVAVMVAAQGIRPFLRWPNLGAALALGGLISLYLLSNDSDADWGWLTRHYNSTSEMLTDLARLYLAEVVLVVVALWLTDRRIAKEPAFIVSVIVLLGAPWITYRYDLTHNIMLRLGTPAVIVLSYYAARAVVSRLPESASSTSRPRQPSKRQWYATLVAVLCVGAVTPVFMLLNSDNRAYHPYERTHKTTLASNFEPSDIPARISTSVPRLLQTAMRDHGQKGLSIGEPIIRSKYDIYLPDQANMLAYLNRDCDYISEISIRLFLHIQIEQGGWKVWPHRQDGSDCTNTIGLPDYRLNRIVVGQYIPYFGILWATEYRYGDTEPVHHIHSNAYQTHSFYYQIAESEEPIIDSIFNVHLASLHQKTVIYTKEPCTLQDTRTPFFLHITPIDPNDLPDRRRQTGFDNYDFHFNDLDKAHINRCLTLIPIPDYPIASISTGQFHPETNHILWQQEADITP